MVDRLRDLFRVLPRGQRKRTFLLLPVMGVGAIMELVGIAMIPAFIGLLGDPERALRVPAVAMAYGYLGLDSVHQLLMWGAIALIGVFVVKNAYLTWLSYLRARVAYDLQCAIGCRLFDAYLKTDYSYHLGSNTSELLRNVRDNVGIIITGVLIPLLTLVMEALTVVLIFALLTYMEPVVSLGAIVFLGALGIGFLAIIRRRNLEYGRREQQHMRGMIQAVHHGLGGFKESLVLGRQGFFLDEFARSASGYASAAKFRKVTSELPRPVLETLAVAGLLLITVGLLARGAEIAALVPTLALFGVAAIRIMPSFKVVVKSYNTIQYYSHALRTVAADLEEIEGLREGGADVPPRAEATATLEFRSHIEFQHVRYRYPEAHEDVIVDASIRIEKGEVVALVGPTGGGKTTMVDLLLGLLEPTSGRILIDGRDLPGIVDGWRRNVGYIPQSIFLSDDSIAANVAFGVPEPDRDADRVWQVLAAAQLDGFVASLPGGLATRVGERGVRISGGQRQRIGIARALYHDPNVLVMDEATAALDTRTERDFLAALEALRSNHTIIMIAHRLSTVERCDRIFLMSRGAVRATGTYQQLVQGSPEFAALATTGR